MKTVAVYEVKKEEVGAILSGLTEDVLSSEQNKFKRCGAHDSRRFGFSPCLNGLYVDAQKGYTLINVTEQIKVPEPLAVEDLVVAKVVQFKLDNDNVEPNKKTKDVFKFEAVEELLPATYPKKEKHFKVMILDSGLILTEATGKKAEEILGLIRKVLGSLPAVPFETETPIGDLLDKLISTQKDDKFELLSKATLIDQLGQQVSLSKESLYNSIAQDLLKEDAYTTSVELFYDGAVSFNLKDNFTLSGVKFSDVVEAEDDDLGTEFLQLNEVIKVIEYIIDSTKGE